MSKLNFYLSNVTMSLSQLTVLEDEIVKFIRSWFGLNNSSNREIMFIPRKCGGLGVINPTTTYIAKKISFLLSTLNSDDPQTRHSARSSLELHMKKRRVDKNNIDSSFACYCTDENGRLVKQCAVNWPKSVWIELNELCMREGLRLEMSGDEYVYISSLDNEVAIVLRNQSTTFNHIKSQHLNNRITRFKTKISQGRILSTPCIDFQISNNYLTNTAINDNLVKSIFKTRLQLLECNSLLHRYYPHVYPKSCLLCNNPFDTVSHVLNGCMIFNDLYIKRHDKIVYHIHFQLTTSRPQFTVYINRLITGNMLNANTTELYANVIHRKPDLLIFDDQLKKAYIVEVSSPYDAFVDQCYNTKFMYYSPLCELINLDTTYSCKIVIIIIGSTGCVHKNVVPGLKMLGFDTRRSKAIAKYLSISDAIGPKIVWQMRVGAVNAQRRFVFALQLGICWAMGLLFTIFQSFASLVPCSLFLTFCL